MSLFAIADLHLSLSVDKPMDILAAGTAMLKSLLKTGIKRFRITIWSLSQGISPGA